MIVKNERGMVLLLVLLVVALLATVLTELSFSTLVDMRLAETFRDTTRANYIARGGLIVGKRIIEQDISVYDATDELWAMGVQQYPVADGDVTIEITDLDGRVPLNLLVLNKVNPNMVVKPHYINLLEELGVDQPDLLVDNLIAWLDPDDDPSADAYYSSLAEPIQCKNGPLDTIDELAIIEGYSPELLKRLRPHVTAYGGGKINVNTATREVLLSLNDNMTPDVVDALLTARQEQPFKTIEQVRDLPGMDEPPTLIYGSISLYIDVKSSNFRVTSTGRVNDGRTTMQAVVDETGSKIKFQRVL